MNVGIYREGGASPGLPLPRTRILGLTIAIGILGAGAIIGPPVLLVAARGSVAGAWMAMKEGGVLWTFLVLLLGVALPVVLVVLGALVVRGRRVPPGIVFALAALPFGIGLLGHFAGLRQTFGAIRGESVDPEQKLRIMAEGTAEAMANDVVSGFVACGCAIVACAVAASAAASIDVKRVTGGAATSKLGVASASVLGLGWLVATLVLAALRLRSAGALVGVPVLAVAAMLPFAMLAAHGAAGLPRASYPDEARHVLGNLAIAAVCAAFAVLALERAIGATSTARALQAITSETIAPSQQVRVLAAAVSARHLGTTAMVLHAVLGLGTFAAAALSGLGGSGRSLTASAVAALALALGLAGSVVGVARAELTCARATAHEEDAAVDGAPGLPSLLPDVAGSDEDGAAFGSSDLVVRADGTVAPDPNPEASSCSPAKLLVRADRAVTASTLSDLLRARHCVDPELMFVAHRELDPRVVAELGDMALFLRRVTYVRTTETSFAGDGSPDVLVVRSTADDAIEVDGVKIPYPIPPRTLLGPKRHLGTTRFVSRPTDSIERIVRTVTSVHDALGSSAPTDVRLVLRVPPRPAPPPPLPSRATLGDLPGGAGRPTLRPGTVQVSGRLSPEVIQRVVRQSFGRFRLCYENGLRTTPTLGGKVTVKFVIDRTGAVSRAEDGGSDVPDAGFVSCVVRAFGSLSFPETEGGIVRVLYPIVFTPQ